MRAVIQRVTQASVRVEGKIVGEIGDGLCILLGVGSGDTEADAEKLADRIVNLRIFEDGEGRMNLSLLETGGGVLIVSQFTLYGDCRKGRRPSFAQAAPAEEANRLYEHFMGQVRQRGVPVSCGIFRTHMLVELANDGPVTLILEA